MNILWNLVGALFLALVLYSVITMYPKIAISRGLIQAAHPFVKEGNEQGRTLLVLGDSVAVGVGAAKPEDSTAGRFAEYAGVSYVENYARIGAKVAELPIQITNAKRERYTYILIAIGGNDIIGFGSPTRAMERFTVALDKLPDAGQVIVHSAGNVGGATLFPFFVRPFYTMLNLKYHAAFEKLAAEKDFTYVNLYEPPSRDPFALEPRVYFAPDGLHPSSEGYRAWFERISSKVELPVR